MFGDTQVPCSQGFGHTGTQLLPFDDTAKPSQHSSTGLCFSKTYKSNIIVNEIF